MAEKTPTAGFDMPAWLSEASAGDEELQAIEEEPIQSTFAAETVMEVPVAVKTTPVGFDMPAWLNEASAGDEELQAIEADAARNASSSEAVMETMTAEKTPQAGLDIPASLGKTAAADEKAHAIEAAETVQSTSGVDAVMETLEKTGSAGLGKPAWLSKMPARQTAKPVAEPAKPAAEGSVASECQPEAPVSRAPRNPVAEADAAEVLGLAETIAEVESEIEVVPEDKTAVSVKDHLLAFRLSDSTFAVDVHQIVRLDEVPRMTPVRHVAHFLHGVTNLRGEIIAVVDMRALLSLGAVEDSSLERMLVVRAGEQQLTVGLIVDGVKGMTTVASDTVRQPSGQVNDKVVPYLKGVCKHEGQLMTVLDLGKLMESPEMRSFWAN